MLSTRPISSGAADITGITAKDGKLYVDCVEVSTISPKMAIKHFISFLQMSGSKVILVAHNCLRFDGPKILQLIEKENMLAEFSNIIYGFCDSYPLFKKKLPERKCSKLGFGLVELAKDYLNNDEIVKAHNAIGDVTMLQKLMFNTEINLSVDDLKSSVLSIQYFQYTKRRSAIVASLTPELSILQSSEEKESKLDDKEKRGLSSGMIKKIAEAGILLKKLRETYATNGNTGITILLGQDVGGKPRVTKSKAIINAMITRLIEISE
ncbi:uncharacterized protein [Chelonus insularis]|uniref:uncharacterized protein n=1 Tax=Chelonus insularis TaxID=460826 RepID=UPI00158D55E0|nr:uncharacterized protein LOC118074976 [Chelonus insularis]